MRDICARPESRAPCSLRRQHPSQVKRKFSPKSFCDCGKNFRRSVCSSRRATWNGCEKSGRNSRLCRCMSSWQAKQRITEAAEVDCVLLDTTGDLRRWYAVATVVFIGKSMTAHGGQNPVEPILAGKPVVFGPHMENFALLAANTVSKRRRYRSSRRGCRLNGRIAELLWAIRSAASSWCANAREVSRPASRCDRSNRRIDPSVLSNRRRLAVASAKAQITCNLPCVQEQQFDIARAFRPYRPEA